MKKILADSDVIIDLLTQREPFFEDIKAIFQLAMEKKLKIHISAVTVVNVNYIIEKGESSTKALHKIKLLLKMADVLDVRKTTIKKAITSGFKDFGDAVQNCCAVESKIDILITRNVKDYRRSNLTVMTPKELLAQLEIS
jgi:predicted nucleic acid-binding protein